MAAGFHGSARTTARIRAELQAAQEATIGSAALDPRRPSRAEPKGGRQVAPADDARRHPAGSAAGPAARP
jgi:hypothetical protein